MSERLSEKVGGVIGILAGAAILSVTIGLYIGVIAKVALWVIGD